MSVIQAKTDVENAFLSRREIVCDFDKSGGKMTKLEAVDMVTKEYSLDGKVVIPIILKNHVGRPTVTGTFYVYEDEALAKSHIDPTIFARLEKANAKVAEKKEAEAKSVEETKTEDKAESDDKPKEESS